MKINFDQIQMQKSTYVRVIVVCVEFARIFTDCHEVEGK